ncbi:MAG: cell division protein SepF [Nanohaloarchaea archaeon]|nr:cell division protein SepF [Candidatus Nanohaloarchaea archaeon]
MGLGFLNSDQEEENENIVEDDFVELDAKMTEKTEKVVVRAETLKEFEDIEEVQEHLRNDHIVWLNIKPLKNRDMTDLKRAVKRLKKTIKAVDGDMAGVDEDWIVATPGYAEIARSSDQVESE